MGTEYQRLITDRRHAGDKLLSQLVGFTIVEVGHHYDGDDLFPWLRLRDEHGYEIFAEVAKDPERNGAGAVLQSESMPGDPEWRDWPAG